MQYRSTRIVLGGLSCFLLALAPAFADTAAGMQAFRAKEYGKAFNEWKAAADAGQAEAQFDLGVLYAQGLGVQRDLTAAERWYRKAAEQGNAEAEFALGQMYSRGWGIPRDQQDALRWFEMAGQPDSDGPATDWSLLDGYGMQQDQKQAAYWYELAAQKGHAEAQFNLGRLYAEGKGGIPHDEEQAVRWVRAAASQGYPPALARLGIRYANGMGIAQDSKRAYFWLTLAYLHGDKSVEKLRSAQAAKLSAEEVSASDQAAQNWKPRTFAAAKKQDR
ncbi:MAG TPA: tetratricopeptide repeat protein [Bryobacteraceae bacterium]|nr:tetratricopeptide repeat protein [Bryobacteraceae bacterium]